MKKYTISATNRTLVGRKVKNLRKQGQIPATVYGKDLKSATIVMAGDLFLKVYKEAGETGLIELHIEKDVRPVLIHTVQIDPVSNAILHVEFHQVDLKEKVHAKVPVELMGISPAVEQKVGVLLTVLSEVEVEALPAELPEKIAVDVTGLSEVNQEVKVGDVQTTSGVTILTDAGLTIVKIAPLVTKEAVAQAAEEEAAAADASATVEGATPETGDTKPAEVKSAPETKSPEKKQS